MKRFLTILFLTASCTLAFGTDYYVRTDGSNSNNGLSNTSGGAWLTVAYACSQVSAGTHTINIGTGTFDEGTNEMVLAVGVSLTGSSKTGTIIISRRATVRNSAGVQSASITLASASEGTNGNQSISFLTLDGDNQTGDLDGNPAYVGILVYRRSNVIVHDCIVKDFFTGGILFHGCQVNYEPTTYSSGNKVYNCSIIDCADTAETWGSAANITIGAQTEMEIYDCILTNNGRAQGHNGNLIKSEYYEKGVKIYRTIFTKIDDDGAEYNFHIEMWNTLGGMEVYDCEFYGGDCAINIAGFFNLKGDYDYSWWIHDNYFESTNLVSSENNNRVTIIMEDEHFQDVIVERNHFYKCPTPIVISNGSVSENIIERIRVSYNVFEECGWDNEDYWSNNLRIENQDAENIMEDILILNNIILTTSLHQTTGIRVDIAGSATNIQIRNNIVIGNDNGAWLIVSNSGSIDGFYVNNNVQYDNTNSNDPSISGNAIANYSYSGAVKSDPLFVGARDFHLQSGSPAKDAGMDVGLTLDYDQYVVPFNTIQDIGAFEFGSSGEEEEDPPAVVIFRKNSSGTRFLKSSTGTKFIR